MYKTEYFLELINNSNMSENGIQKSTDHPRIHSFYNFPEYDDTYSLAFL